MLRKVKFKNSINNSIWGIFRLVWIHLGSSPSMLLRLGAD